MIKDDSHHNSTPCSRCPGLANELHILVVLLLHTPIAVVKGGVSGPTSCSRETGVLRLVASRDISLT
jgi:hypothetical protein